jgi:CRP/FNR family transcriptional regulator, transcriptional activator FtrB
MRRTDLEPIRRARLLCEVPRSELAAMLAPCFVQPLPEGALLCRQGEKPEFLHIVVSGRVGLFGESGHDEALVEIFGPGDAFIVAAVALEVPSLLTARMLDEGRILMWPAASFRAQLRASGPLAYGAMLQLSNYWRMLVNQIKDLKLLSAVERLSALLLALAPRGSGSAKAMLPGNRGLVAGLLGVAPQSLSRAFFALRPIGVSGGGREISIVSTARLREFAGRRVRKDANGEGRNLGIRRPKRVASRQLTRKIKLR